MHFIIEHAFKNNRPRLKRIALPINRIIYLHMQFVHFGQFDYPPQD